MARDVVTYREFCNPELCGRTVAGFTFPPLSSYPSMLENTTRWDPVEKACVLEYMRDRSHLRGASTSTWKTDVFNGRKIDYVGDIYEDDAGYKWPDYLAYYVDAYNVSLPDDFVRHVLEEMR